MWNTWVGESTSSALKGAGQGMRDLVQHPSRVVAGGASFVPDVYAGMARGARDAVLEGAALLKFVR